MSQTTVRGLHEDLLQLLACPDCSTAVRIDEVGERDRAGRVVAGSLICATCSSSYPIRRGIPRFVFPTNGSTDVTDTSLHFAKEFTALAHEDRDIDPPELVEYYFYSRSGLDPDLYEKLPGDPGRTTLPPKPRYEPDKSFLRDKVVLDAGCGPGRFTRIAATSASLVVGLDIGDHVDRAATRCADLPNVGFVQGSVLAPPFVPGVFDYLFTIGVLHHTPAPREGLHRLARLVQEDGSLSVWVYGPEYWNGRIRGPLARALHRVLSRLEPEVGLAVCSRLLYPLGRVQMALARRRWTKLLAAPLFVLPIPRHPTREVMIATIYDYYCPPIISTHTYDEVRRWLVEAGFSELRQIPVPTGWFAGRMGFTGGNMVPRSQSDASD